LEFKSGDGASPAQKGQPQQGRPLNSKDSQKRKKKRVLPRTSASASTFVQGLSYARKAQKFISEIVDPIWLSSLGKKNDMRKLTNEEEIKVDKFKNAILCSLNLYEDLTEEKITSLFFKEDLSIPYAVELLAKETITSFVDKFGKQPTNEEVKQIWASVYTLYKGEF
jgi:hypothetical protein